MRVEKHKYVQEPGPVCEQEEPRPVEHALVLLHLAHLDNRLVRVQDVPPHALPAFFLVVVAAPKEGRRRAAKPLHLGLPPPLNLQKIRHVVFVFLLPRHLHVLGRLHVAHFVPVDPFEERVALDVTSPSWPIPQSILWICHQELLHQICSLQRHHPDPRHRVIHLLDLLKRQVLAPTPKRRLADDHLVQEAAERPPVHGSGGHASVEDLGRSVLRRAHKARFPLRLRPVLVVGSRHNHLNILEQLDASKIAQLEVTFFRQE